MSMVIVMLVILGAGWFVWRRRRYQQAHALRISSQVSPKENLAQQHFAHGNTCLMEGNFDEARTAFHQARDLKPTHPHIAGRLAEVERRQQAASATSPDNSTV